MDLPNAGIEPGSPALQADSLPTKLPDPRLSPIYITGIFSLTSVRLFSLSQWEAGPWGRKWRGHRNETGDREAFKLTQFIHLNLTLCTSWGSCWKTPINKTLSKRSHPGQVLDGMKYEPVGEKN